jgi:hypothetical protein
MKIWLDDIRPAPEGWVWVKTVEEFKQSFEQAYIVEAVSFDNDLGEGEAEGWEAVNWLEEQVFTGKVVAPETLMIHSANPPARQRMQAGIFKILMIDES